MNKDRISDQAKDIKDAFKEKAPVEGESAVQGELDKQAGRSQDAYAGTKPGHIRDKLDDKARELEGDDKKSR